MFKMTLKCDLKFSALRKYSMQRHLMLFLIDQIDSVNTGTSTVVNRDIITEKNNIYLMCPSSDLGCGCSI